MSRSSRRWVGFGVLALLLALASLVDMFRPRPWDGVLLSPDSGRAHPVVAEVVRGSGAKRAGILAGDEIVGIDGNILKTTRDAARILAEHEIGDSVRYLVSRNDIPVELPVELGHFFLGDASYLYVCLVGLLFFIVGSFVFAQQPELLAARAFYQLCLLFMLTLVCRLRPSSYSLVDTAISAAGTVALCVLPAAFLRFFLNFPQPARSVGGWIATLASRRSMVVAYLLPVLVWALARSGALGSAGALRLRGGAPLGSWWLMGIFMIGGLVVLACKIPGLGDRAQAEGAILVLIGTLLGSIPFLALAVAAPSLLSTERYVFLGVLPLILVPLTFAFAIVRYHLLDVHLIVRKSLLYTATLAVLTIFYALSIAAFNTLIGGSRLATSPYFPLVFALVILLLFEPLRSALRSPIERFFFRGRSALQQALVEVGEELTGETEPSIVVRDLVDRLPRLLELDYAGLYLKQGDNLARAAGPELLPRSLQWSNRLSDELKRRGGIVRLDELMELGDNDQDLAESLAELDEAGVEVLALLSSRRRNIGLALLPEKTGQMRLETDELRLLRGLFDQVSIALETSLLLSERARRAELQRELKIAAEIQSSLLPDRLECEGDWLVEACCHPAKVVGGDFFSQLPAASEGSSALVWGDVSGKSIPGALVMMAAHEILQALAIGNPEPGRLLELANKRLYCLGRRGFVALGYLELSGEGRLRYALAGQPTPLIRRADGRVESLDLPATRLPLGAMAGANYPVLESNLQPGEVLVAYTDGVIEAFSPDDEMFGLERLEATVATASGGPREVVDTILRAVLDFTAQAPASDDLTLVVVGRSATTGR